MKEIVCNLSKNAEKVLEKRYLKKDEQGKALESADDMFQRVATNIAQAEKIYNKDAEWEKTVQEFYSLMANLEFLPNSPTLMNAGRDLQQLSACFVIPIEDSMESIFEAVKDTSMIHKSGGGTGFSFSRLRPKNSRVRSTGGVASGPVSFLKVFDAATQAVKQGGCVAPDTRIATGKGLLKIKDLGPADAPADSWHKYNPHPVVVATDNGLCVSDEFYNHGVSPVFTIKTKNGYKVTGTPQHRLRVINENGEYVWRHIKDIKVGDWVALQKDTFMDNRDYRLPDFTKKPHFNATKVDIPSMVSKELGEFIGAFVGDGSFTRNKRRTGRLIFSFSDQDKELKNYILKIAKDLFGVRPIVQKKKGDASTNYYFNATALVDWFQFIGVHKPSSLTVRVPEIVFISTREFAKGFLKGLFSTDGTVTEDGYPSLCSVSLGLIEDAQQLFLALGIPTKICKVTNRKNAFGKNPIYHLRVITLDGLRRFVEEIGFIGGYKNRRLKNAMSKAWEFNDIIPNQEKLLKQLYNGPGRGCGPNRSKLGANRRLYRDIQHYLPAVDAPRNLTRSRLEKLTSKHPQLSCCQRIQRLLKNEQFYDQVMSIEDGRSLTLDLSVPANNTYIANGFVSHNTRRGANMGILRVDHPDILEFIFCKESDKEITNFNISVTVTEDFMQRVKDNQEYDLIDPHTKKVTGRLNAKEVFEKIVKMAWKNGEPGIIFIDRMNKFNPTPALGEYESTNPCVSIDTWIMTKDGPRRVAELLDKKIVAIIDGQEYESTSQGFFKTGVKPIYRLKTKEGFQARFTLDHPLLKVKHKSKDKVEVEWSSLSSLNAGDEILLNNHASLKGWEGNYSSNEGYLVGLIMGDGTLKKNQVIISSWGRDKGAFSVREEVFRIAESFPHRKDFKGWTKIKGREEHRLSLCHLKGICDSLGVGLQTKKITEQIEKASSQFARGFLKGLFDADGSVQGTQEKGVSIRLSQSDLELLKCTQRMLLRLGIYSKIYPYRREEGKRSLPDGRGAFKEYSIKAQHELIVSEENILRFAEKIGFKNFEKEKRLNIILQSYKRKVNREFFLATVKSLEFEGIEDVYDVRIPGINAFDANGFKVHNCGEQVLLPYESCNLGSINLSKMVAAGKIDWDKLAQTTKIAVHFLDNVIDMNKYPLPKIEEITKGNRKIGLGVMGFADMLIKLNIPYNSEEAVSCARKVMNFILERATSASCELAKERGTFPNFEKSIYDVEGGARLRNATLTTIAPTGTLSIIANCSSGIEPLFAVSYLRKVLDEKGLPEVHPIFEEIAKERSFYSVELMRLISQGKSIQDIPEIPEDVRRIFVTSHDILPEWHIRMQATYQEFTNNAVSKTVNFPQHATVEDVDKVYKTAYELGCKGVTIYRDKSRQEQVLNLGRQESPEKATGVSIVISPRPRPQVVIGTTTKINTGCGNLYITINEDEEGRPFEVFMQMGKAGGCAASQLEAIGRLVSLALRSDVDLKSIIDQLRGIRCPSPSWSEEGRIFSCADAIARVIENRLSKRKESKQAKQEIEKPTEQKGDIVTTQVKVTNIIGVCPDCGSALHHEEGCVLCAACGYSRC